MDHKNSFSRYGSVETLHIASGIANYGSFVWKQAPKIGFEFDHPPHSARDCRQAAAKNPGMNDPSLPRTNRGCGNTSDAETATSWERKPPA